MEIDDLVHTHTDTLLRAALALGFPPGEAKDLIQSVWLTYMEVSDTFEGRSHVRTFLFGILYNKAKEKRRNDGKLVPDEAIEVLIDAQFDSTGHWRTPPLNPEQFTQASQVMQLIKACLEGLPLNQRMAFCFREVEDYDTEEICKIMRQSATNLGVLLYRAKTRLRACIEKKAHGLENV